jgi:mxaK protein
MDAARRVTRVLWLAAALLALGAGYECLRLQRALAYADAVRADDLEAAARIGDAYGAFAAALGAQRARDLDAARRGYDAALARDGTLRADVRYNLANAYLRRALELGDDAGDDVVGPLIELAKQQYRDVLRIEPGAWDAKYNLELALSVQPDVEDVPPADEQNPERSRQAIATQRKLQRLP